MNPALEIALHTGKTKRGHKMNEHGGCLTKCKDYTTDPFFGPFRVWVEVLAVLADGI